MSTDSSADTVEFSPIIEVVSFEPIQPFSSLVEVDFGAATDRGKVRPHNEDSFLIYRTGRYWQKLMTSLPADDLPDSYEDRAYVMAVADGIGGSAAGEVASTMALRAVVHLVLNAAKWALKFDDSRQRPTEIQEAKDLAAEFMRRVDQTLTQTGERHPELRGMGTTLTASYSVGDDLFIVHIGDSRAYLYREGVLEQLTNDHTIAQALASVGAITQEEASTHALRHVLTKAIGSQGGQIEAEITQYRLADGDRLLLCTDGLSDMVNNEQIAEVLARQGQATAACQELVNLALENGGKDNITVALAGYRIPQRPDSKQAT